MDKNLDQLMNAAKTKLEKQQELESGPNGDIYAGIREEAESEEYAQYPQLEETPALNRTPEPEFTETPINENDVQVYENGPFLSQVEIWKKQYGNIFHIKILDRDFVFRTLNRYEYKQLVALENTDALMREEIICSRCVLHPRNYTFKTMASDDAGYPGMVSQIIMETSGFTKDYGIEVL